MILIVEDDAVTGHILQAALQRLRLPSTVASTGAEALEKLATIPVDVAIVDLYLPDMAGLELVTAIRSRPYVSDLPLMCCTADSSARTVLEARAHGIVDFLAKPISILDFSRRIQHILQNRRPPRWELQELRFRRFEVALISSLLEMTAVAVDSCISMLETGASDAELSPELFRTAGSAEQVGALRLALQIQRLWPSDRESLLTALRIERVAISLKAPKTAPQHSKELISSEPCTPGASTETSTPSPVAVGV